MVGHGASLSELPSVSAAALSDGFTSYVADSSAKLLNRLKAGVPIRPRCRKEIVTLTDYLRSRKTPGTIGH